MAGGMDLGTSHKGGKKSLDTAINLVPFIDLMAVTISFLIMTAVWNQINRLQVSQAGGPGSDSPPPANQPKTLPLTLTVTERGFSLSTGGSQIDLPKKDNAYDIASLDAKLKAIKADYPDQTTITISSEDSIKYQDLVRAIDTCIGGGLPDVSVTAAVG